MVNNKFIIIFVANNDFAIMVKLKTGFVIRAGDNFAEKRKLRVYNVAISPFEFKDNYDNFPNVDYTKYPVDYLVVDTKIWALMLRDLPRIAYSMAMQIAYVLEPNTNMVKITQQISSAVYSRSGKSSTYWTTVVNQLEDYGFLVRTNQRSTYVINHNIIFKGDLSAFAKKYKDLYGDYKGAYDKNGKLIIDKRNQIRENFRHDEVMKKVQQINYRANKYNFKPAND